MFPGAAWKPDSQQSFRCVFVEVEVLVSCALSHCRKALSAGLHMFLCAGLEKFYDISGGSFGSLTLCVVHLWLVCCACVYCSGDRWTLVQVLSVE